MTSAGLFRPDQAICIAGHLHCQTWYSLSENLGVVDRNFHDWTAMTFLSIDLISGDRRVLLYWSPHCRMASAWVGYLKSSSLNSHDMHATQKTT